MVTFRKRRDGFTIIELLVVITIIAILMTLVVRVVGSFISQARDSATRAELGKIQGIINSRSQAFNRLLMRKGYISGSNEFYIVQQGFRTYSSATQNTVATKLLDAKFFPQGVAELGNSINAQQQSQVSQLYPNLINKYLTVFSQAHPPGQNINDLSQYKWQLDMNHALRSSEILYDFLTQSNMLGGAPVGMDAFSDSEVKDTDGNGLPEFIDAWGNPLRFYRWPTRYFRSGGVDSSGNLTAISATDVQNAQLLFSSLPVFSGNLANDLNRDPDDPLRNCLAIPKFEQMFHTPCTYHVLLVVSAGQDGQLGIYEPDDTTNFGNLAQPIPGQQDALTDNITYLNIRAGGK